MAVSSPLDVLPDWLLDYAAHCEPDLPLQEPVALLEAASESPTDSIASLQPLASRRAGGRWPYSVMKRL